MEPRHYQAEAFDAARKSNVVMIGATGVGKTLVSLMLIRDFYFEDARRREAKTHKWCIFLCPTQELVFQQARCAQVFTGVRCAPYVGKDLDYWGLRKWRGELESKEVLVMTPNALLNLLHRGKKYLTLANVGVLVFDECHQARKKHPYARVMAFYLELMKDGGTLPKVFGMTASPTVECVEVLQSKAYVCEDTLIEEYQANAQWELLSYPAFKPSKTVVGELESLMRMLFSDLMCGFADTKERFVDTVVTPVLFSYQHLGLWCAVRHMIMFCEGFLRSRAAERMLDRMRVRRVERVVRHLIRRLLESPLGFAAAGIELPQPPPPSPSSASSQCSSPMFTPPASPTRRDKVQDRATGASRAADGGVETSVTPSANPAAPSHPAEGTAPAASATKPISISASTPGNPGRGGSESVSVADGGGASPLSSEDSVAAASAAANARDDDDEDDGGGDSDAAVASNDPAVVGTEAPSSSRRTAARGADSSSEAAVDGDASVRPSGNDIGNFEVEKISGGVQEKGDAHSVEKTGAEKESRSSKQRKADAATAMAEAGEWGLTPGRITTLLKALVRVKEEWSDAAKHFRCMVFVERRATARVLSEYLSHCLIGRLKCGFVVGRAKSRGTNVHGGRPPRRKEWRPVPDDIDQGSKTRKEMETAPGSAPGNAAPEGSGGNPAEAEAGAGPGPGEDGKDAGENSGDEDIEGGNAFDVADTGREKLDEAASEDEEEEGVPRSRVAQTIDLFRRGEIQVLVTTDACSEGIDIPECNLVISMDKIKTSRSLIHTRGRARSKGGKFVIMVEKGDDVEKERVALMLLESEDIKRFQLSHERASTRVPLHHSHPNMVHRIEKSKAVVDMDMAMPLMNEALSALGCDYHPLFVVEKKPPRRGRVSRGATGASFRCRLELPSFLGIPTIDTEVMPNEHFWNKPMARAAVSYLAVLRMLEKGLVDDLLNPKRTKDRLVVETRRGYDPVLVEGKEARVKATMPIPRPIAMGILSTPTVDFEEARQALWRANSPPKVVAEEQGACGEGEGLHDIVGVSPRVALTNGVVDDVEMVAGDGGDALAVGSNDDDAVDATASRDPSRDAVGADDGTSGSPFVDMQAEHLDVVEIPTAREVGANDGDGHARDVAEENTPTPEGSSLALGDKNDGDQPNSGAAASGAGSVVWEGAWVRRCYENVPGSTCRMRVYCFRSPPGEIDGWVPQPKERKGSSKDKKQGGDEKGGGEEEGSKEEGDKAEENATETKEKEEGDGAEAAGEKAAEVEAEDSEEEEEHEANMRCFHPKLKVDLGRGPGKGIGPRLFVGLASATPLPLTACQASKLGVEQSFDVDLNPAQMAAVVQWHRETVGMASLYEIPHQMTQTPKNDPANTPFRNTGDVGDKGMLAIPVEYGEGGAWEGPPRIDWAAIEAANAGVHLPDDTDEDYTHRILFSRVSHKTCRFYFVLERTNTTLATYLRRCLESDLGPYAGLPCETITLHDAGRMGRVKGVLAVGHGVRKPDYDAAYKAQRLVLGVPAPALRQSFAQHLIRGERIMDPDAGVRGRVKVSPSSEGKIAERDDKDGTTKPKAENAEEPSGEGQGTEKPKVAEGTEQDGDGTTPGKGRAMEIDSDGGDMKATESTVKMPDGSLPETAAVSALGAEVMPTDGIEGEGEGWAGVSMLKSNNHKVGPGQPVLLVEQYCQPVCVTRRVFVSVLHIVPRMFDLERQLLCFVLHESLFLPALQASLYHRSGAAGMKQSTIDITSSIVQQEVCDEPTGTLDTTVELLPNGNAPDASQAVAPGLASMEAISMATNDDPSTPTPAEPAIPSAASQNFSEYQATGPEEDPQQRIVWPSNGTWSTPGQGAGVGSGPGGILDPAGSTITDGAETSAAAQAGAAAAAEAAAMGVIKWQGGTDGAVADTMALLDCSLRRPVNERLETLGDAWLNYYAGFVVFQDKPVMLEEGLMTLLRKNVVSNARLIKCADGRGLREFMYPPRSILGRPFDMWSPSLLPLPPPVKASRKTIADVVEALLGAALVAGGNRSAAYLMEWLGLPTLESSNNPDKIESDTPPPTVEPTKSDEQLPRKSVGVETDAEGVTSPGLGGDDAGMVKGPVAVAHLSGATVDAAAEDATEAGAVAAAVEEGVGACASNLMRSSEAPRGDPMDEDDKNPAKPSSDGPEKTDGAVAEADAAVGSLRGIPSVRRACSTSSFSSCSSGTTSAFSSAQGGVSPLPAIADSGAIVEEGGPSNNMNGTQSVAAAKRKIKSRGEGVPCPKRIRTPEGPSPVGGGDPTAADDDEAMVQDDKVVDVGVAMTGVVKNDAVVSVTPTTSSLPAETASDNANVNSAVEGPTAEKATESGDLTDPPSGNAATGAGDKDAACTAVSNHAASAKDDGDCELVEAGDSGDEGGNPPEATKNTDKKPSRVGRGKGKYQPDHVPEVDDRKRPWLWNPPGYMSNDPGKFGALDYRAYDCDDMFGDEDEVLFSGDPDVADSALSPASGASPAGDEEDDSIARGRTQVNQGVPRASSGESGGGVGGLPSSWSPVRDAPASAEDLENDPAPGRVSITDGLMDVEEDAGPATAAGAGDAEDEKKMTSPAVEKEKAADTAEVGNGSEEQAGEVEKKHEQDADAADREPGAGGGGEGGQGEEAEVAKADAAEMGRAQKPWAGLPLEGMKGSARWPIRREPLMSAKFLADTGVLPKEYVTTKPSARLMGNIRRLEKSLGYTFKHPWLCMQAITHPSWTMFDRAWKHEAADGTKGGHKEEESRPSAGRQDTPVDSAGGKKVAPGTVAAQDYQRLEFLGDAVLGWLVTAHLYFASSSFTPAELTRIKASCVCNASLWVIALKLNVHHVLRASPKILGNVHSFIENQNNKMHPGNSTPPKHPADVLEALIAAVFLDSSCCMNTVSRVFWPLIAQYLQDHPPPAEEELDGGMLTKPPPGLAAPPPAAPPAPADAEPVPPAIATTGDAPVGANGSVVDEAVAADVAGSVVEGQASAAEPEGDAPALDDGGAVAGTGDNGVVEAGGGGADSNEEQEKGSGGDRRGDGDAADDGAGAVVRAANDAKDGDDGGGGGQEDGFFCNSCVTTQAEQDAEGSVDPMTVDVASEDEEEQQQQQPPAASRM